MALIVLRTFDNAIDAHLLKTKLESEGIPVYLFDEHINTLQPLYNMATGGIKLNIPEDAIDHALSILQEIDNLPYTDSQERIINCPACGSTDLYNNYRSMTGIKGVLSAIVSFLLLIFPIYYRVLYKCKSCGKTFRPEHDRMG